MHLVCSKMLSHLSLHFSAIANACAHVCFLSNFSLHTTKGQQDVCKFMVYVGELRTHLLLFA